jgi:aconitate hydratase
MGAVFRGNTTWNHFAVDRPWGRQSFGDFITKDRKVLPIYTAAMEYITESFERIHRSNSVGMGVVPSEFINGETAESLGLTGKESYTITGIAEGFKPGKLLTVVARGCHSRRSLLSAGKPSFASQPAQEAGKDACSTKTFQIKARVDTSLEIECLKNGGVLNYVLRNFIADA